MLTDEENYWLTRHIGPYRAPKIMSTSKHSTIFNIKNSSCSFVLKKITRPFAQKQLIAEVEGLELLRLKSNVIIPEIIGAFGNIEQHLLLMSFIETSNQIPSSEQFSTDLNQLHNNTNSMYGYTSDNFIGPLEQHNKLRSDWSDFYVEFRLEPLVANAYNVGLLDLNLLHKFDKLYASMNNLFPKEPPALLHGDLWHGNYLNSVNGNGLIDPAIYYGHREMDLGMMALFGGFDADIYISYSEIAGLEKSWQNRLKYAQLYPLLVHLRLFGKTYLSQIEQTMKVFN